MRKTFGLCPEITRISAVPVNVLEFNITVKFLPRMAQQKPAFCWGFSCPQSRQFNTIVILWHHLLVVGKPISLPSITQILKTISVVLIIFLINIFHCERFHFWYIVICHPSYCKRPYCCPRAFKSFYNDRYNLRR